VQTNPTRLGGGGLGEQYAQNGRWVQQIGRKNSSSIAESQVSFDILYDGEQPIITTSVLAGTGSSLAAVISDFSERGFLFSVRDEGDNRTTNGIFWSSWGTVTF
jgi:hypothetical protein